MNDSPKTEPMEVEAIEPDLETGPDAGGLVVTSETQIKDIAFLADNIEKLVGYHVKIRTAILKLAQPGDWVLFGKKAEIGFAGANRIGSTLGVSYMNWQSEKLVGHDELGDWYRWEYQADASYAGRSIRVYGRCGSRDKLFGYEKGKWKELSGVNEGNIKIAAMRACKKEGVKDLFGLHHLDPEFLKKNGITLEAAGGYEHKSEDAKAAETQTVNVHIEGVTVKKGEKWTRYDVKDVEGVVYGTFSETIAAEAKKCAELKTLAKLDFIVDQKYGPKLVSINGIVGGQK